MCCAPSTPTHPQGPKGSVSDKLRLVLIQLLSADAPPSDTELQELTAALHAAGEGWECSTSVEEGSQVFTRHQSTLIFQSTGVESLAVVGELFLCHCKSFWPT
jgi:hypothetical protein